MTTRTAFARAAVLIEPILRDAAESFLTQTTSARIVETAAGRLSVDGKSLPRYTAQAGVGDSMGEL